PPASRFGIGNGKRNAVSRIRTKPRSLADAEGNEVRQSVSPTRRIFPAVACRSPRALGQFGATHPSLGHATPEGLVLRIAAALCHGFAFCGESQKPFGRAYGTALCMRPDPHPALYTKLMFNQA